LDLIAANPGGNGVSILLGDGQGGFGQRATYGTVSPSNDREAMAVADLNGDGNLDLAIVNGGHSVALLFGNGDGSFQPQIDLAASSAFGLAVGDLNNDGAPDIAVSNQVG